ncbi:MAG: histidine kinase, partial [Bacteroidetes bacterium]|nr:histidine kinase [Bacteroidota bacterium]
VNIPTNLQPDEYNDPEKEAITGNHLLKLLIVEDNYEFRTFLQTELSDKYSIITASNGKEGLECAINSQPDLVITDVMMPEMSGTELCQQLKKNILTSHIPLILLTAKTSDKAQIEGFEAGADAYISKPFNMNILLLQIQHLIEQRDQRKILFKNEISIDPDSLTSTHVDKKLIKDALQHIEKNMDNTSYSVEQLSKDLYMDRTGLYRKLSAIVGQTPSEFIRSVRLKKSAQLLQKGLPVSEVASLVGFGTTSYFTKCFQNEFGVKPSQYKNIDI